MSADTSDHTLTGHFPTEVIKKFSLTEDGEIEEEIEGEGHRPGHLSGNYVECSCGEQWEGVDAEEQAKEHLKETQQPKEVFVVLDPTDPQAHDLADPCGELVNGVQVLRNIYDPDGACEYCETKGAYYLKDDPVAGLCREHLPEHPGYLKVVESEEELETFRDSRPRPPTREEQEDLKQFHVRQGLSEEQAEILAKEYNYAVFDSYTEDMPGFSGKVLVALYGVLSGYEAYTWDDDGELELVEPERAKTGGESQ